jgi:hypothetical protein
MSANTLTGLIPFINDAADQISREMVGFIPSVYLNPKAEQVAKDQNVVYPVVGVATAADATPAATLPDPSGVTVGAGTMAITKVRKSNFVWNGEEAFSVKDSYPTIKQNQFLQAMRVLVNEMEADLAALYAKASRAYGVAGTAPFASTLADPAQVRKILADNGSPMTDLQMVINTTAGAAMRTLAQLTKVNEAGSQELVRNGVLLDIHGFKIRESAQVKTHTAGDPTGYLVDLTAGYAVGLETIHVDTGTGSFLAGDVVTNNKTARDANKYVVTTGFVGDGDGDIVLAEPGLKVAWVNNDPLDNIATYTANMAFDRNAIHLLTRLPKMPESGDAALDEYVVTDPISGISFQVLEYGEYRQKVFEVAVAWGVKAVKPEHMALLVG